MPFREVEHKGEMDSNVKDLEFDLVATNIAIDIINNAIDVKYDKVYKDINGSEFKRVPMSYRVTEEVKIDSWDAAVGELFKTAIVSEMKERNGIV